MREGRGEGGEREGVKSRSVRVSEGGEREGGKREGGGSVTVEYVLRRKNACHTAY